MVIVVWLFEVNVTLISENKKHLLVKLSFDRLRSQAHQPHFPEPTEPLQEKFVSVFFFLTDYFTSEISAFRSSFLVSVNL